MAKPGMPGPCQAFGQLPSGRPDAAPGDTRRDDPDEQLPRSRGPRLDARPADRVLLGAGDVVSRALDEHAPALLGGQVDAVDLERHLVVGAVDAGPQILPSSSGPFAAVRNTTAPSCSA